MIITVFVDLTIKSFGLSPNSGKLCIFLESLISTVDVELSNMNSEKGLDSEQATILKHHQQSCCIELIKKLVQAFCSQFCDLLIFYYQNFLFQSIRAYWWIDLFRGDKWSCDHFLSAFPIWYSTAMFVAKTLHYSYRWTGYCLYIITVTIQLSHSKTNITHRFKETISNHMQSEIFSRYRKKKRILFNSSLIFITGRWMVDG